MELSLLKVGNRCAHMCDEVSQCVQESERRRRSYLVRKHVRRVSVDACVCVRERVNEIWTERERERERERDKVASLPKKYLSR